MDLRAVRVEKKLTQAQLAKKSGVSRILISKAENGDFSRLTYAKMQRLADTLGMTMKKLFFEN